MVRMFLHPQPYIMGGNKVKLHDFFEVKKEDHFDAVVMIKSGKFYVTFDKDAEILHKLLGYKVVHHRVGFPESAKEQVIQKLNEKHLSYLLDEEKNSDSDNQYFIYLKQIQEEELIENMCNNLLKKMKEVVVKNSDNYGKIRNFLNEL